MNLYYELLSKPLFRMDDVRRFYRTEGAARSALQRLLRRGEALKIRANLYTCVGGAGAGPVATRFQIAGAITESSFLSHQSAMEYYGAADQVSYEVYVGSATRFREFDFAGYHYRFVQSRFRDGVVQAPFSGGVVLTDKERTVIDCIKDMDRIGGLEETLADISAIGRLSGDKLLRYLELYGNQFLYQKTGFLLERGREGNGLGDGFFSACLARIGKSKRYLTADKVGASTYVARWQLIVPNNIDRLKNGGDENAEL